MGLMPWAPCARWAPGWGPGPSAPPAGCCGHERCPPRRPADRAALTMPAPGALISVIIPAYQCQATLARTLDSVWAQAYPQIETVIMDDGSTDATGQIAAEA